MMMASRRAAKVFSIEASLSTLDALDALDADIYPNHA
jgi:hypothetical protein